MSTAILSSSHVRSSSAHHSQPLSVIVSRALARVGAWLRPHEDTPIEAAARLRRLANHYSSQPSFAADLHAAADRHEQLHGIE